MDVTGKVALITGSARGLGKAYAEALLKRGGKVVLTDILVDAGLATEAEFKAQYGESNVMFIQGDVTKQESMESLFDTIMKEFGGLDIVINNAGIGSYRDVRLTYEINVFSVIRCCELAIKHMSQEHGGRGGVIVNIASTAGLYTFNGCEMYQSSKHAVAGYSGAMGKRLAAKGSGIRLMGLCPAFVKTELTKYTQDKEKAGDAQVLAVLKASGGWTEVSDVVASCMKMIESEVPAGSLIQIDTSGMRKAQPENMPLVDVL